MSDFLQQMAQLSAERAAAIGDITAKDLDKPVLPLEPGSFGIIAEIKNRSPAEGLLTDASIGRAQRAELYAQGGAAAISVLTEPSQFDGALSHLEEVVAAVPKIPVMRKDFLVDTAQIIEARAAGASGVLLIAAMLSDRQLRSMLDSAFEHGMFVLLEAFGRDDLSRCSALLEDDVNRKRGQRGQLLFGVNTRNLRTLHVDPTRLETLATELPAGLCVAESGLYTADDAATVAALGYRLALVGTALMQSADPAALIAGMREAGRARVAA